MSVLAFIAGDASQYIWLMGDAADATQRAEMILHLVSVQSLTHEGRTKPSSMTLLHCTLNPSL